MQQIGRYEIIRELGQGGMATVYLAFDSLFERQVAVKVLPRQFTHEPRFLQRFEQEAKTIAALEDAAIVPVYDYGADQEWPYLVMRYMSGGTLGDLIGDGQAMALEEIARILSRLAPALDKAHAKGIVHRDLKPENVLFDEERRPYLADFGIARMADATRTITLQGTPAYMSPEQAEGEAEPDGRSDIYSLGVMLFEMLTGRQPYVAKTPTKQIIMHILQPVPDVLQANPDLPEQTQAIIDKVMAKDREERYRTAVALAEAVQQLLTVSGPALAPAVPLAALSEIETAAPADVSQQAQVVIQEEADAELLLEPLPQEVVAAVSHASAVDEEVPDSAAPSSEREQPQEGVRLPAWAWWVGAIAVVLLLAFGIRAMFGGGGDEMTQSTAESGAALAALTPTTTQDATLTPEPSIPPPDPTLDKGSSGMAEPTEDTVVIITTLEPTVRATDTAIPPTAMITATPVPANTETSTPRPTATKDPNVQPSNPVLGSAWVRPQDMMKMVYVPSGTFPMGLEDYQRSYELPLHDVTLDSFWIDRTEISNAQFADFLNEMGNQQQEGLNWLLVDGIDAQIKEQNGSFAAKTATADHPVAEVSWYGAVAYCEWAGGELPTEAQWEYAARGPKGNTYPWGEEQPTCSLAQYSECDGDTVPVGSLPQGASWAGVQDMAGNVWEWVTDWFVWGDYPTAPAFNPTGLAPVDNRNKVIRGGSWRNGWLYQHSTFRQGWPQNTRDDEFGFRCVVPAR